MKTTKLIIALGLLAGVAQAATITVSAGLTSQGVTPLLGGVVVTNYFTGVGNWNTLTSVFTPFGSINADTGEVSTAVTATSPATFNSTLIAVFVGTGNSIANSGTNWAVFTSTNNTSFPSDVSGATGVTFAMTTPAVLNVVGKGDVGSGFVAGGVNTNNFNFVPEPSAALLGALGALGLLRRRRN
jgi:hypothetical protein